MESQSRRRARAGRRAGTRAGGAEPVAARGAVSSPETGTGGVASGKSGVAVFERGVGIAAWQGLEIGYEVDVVLEVPAGKEERRRRLRRPRRRRPRRPRRRWRRGSGSQNPWRPCLAESARRGGASVFADGVGFVTFRNAVTQVDEVAAAAPEKLSR